MLRYAKQVRRRNLAERTALPSSKASFRARQHRGGPDMADAGVVVIDLGSANIKAGLATGFPNEAEPRVVC